jgi:nucleoside-diphosphate-sugar epimerase
MSTVLVTGGSGFIAAHTMLQLLAAGHRVRTTVRSLQREADVRAMLRAGGVEAGTQLSFFCADLSGDAGWAHAAAGCDYVMHMASPLPADVPRNADELIATAREGTLRVLRAARDEGVKRVVLTSSFAAIGYGHRPQDVPFDERTWTNTLAADLSAYTMSKSLAERAAWDFIAQEGGGLELAVINPVVVLGPVLGPDYSSSILLVERMLSGAVPACPKLSFGLVDVRDVAELHMRAMTHPAAKGERFLAIAGDFVSMREIALVLRRRLGKDARKVSTLELPNWVVRIAAQFVSQARLALPELGKVKHATSEKAQQVLGWTPRSSEESIVDTAQSLLRLGLLK